MRFCSSCPDCGLYVPYNAGICPFCGSRRPGFLMENNSDLLQ